MQTHIRILGILNIVYGSMSALAGVVLALLFGGAYGVIRFASASSAAASGTLPAIAIVGGVLSVGMLAISAPSIIAGVGLLRNSEWARICVLVLSALHLFSFPLGTALGVYGFWVLYSRSNREYPAAPNA